MDILSMLAGPAVGAVIGYVTNDIAIKMLFRPHRAIYVLGHRLPFTPGIVPRRKDRLAAVLGSAVVEKFFNADDLEKIFTSDYFSSAVADSVTGLLTSGAPLGSAAGALPEGAVERAEEELCVRIQAAVCTSGLPRVLADKGRALAAQLMSSSGAGRAVISGLTDSLAEPMAREIEEYVINEGRSIILPLIKRELTRLADEPVSSLTALAEPDPERLHEAVRELYLKFMRRNVRHIVGSIDVGGMITEKIVLMSSEEVEDLVLTVVRRELRMVVLFGALLGGVIGAVNIFI